MSCADKVICPAYQSSFIHSKDELRKKFSYFEEDTLPKVLTASKTKYLIAVPESYRKRYRKMQTVAMRPVYTVLEDSSKEEKDIPPSLLTYQKNIDSIKLAGMGTPGEVKPDSVKKAEEDSVYVITKDKEVRILRYNFPDSLKYDSAQGKYVREKAPYYYVDEVGYNVEQENYMWFFRKELILPDVRLSKIKPTEKPANAKPGVETKKKGFFQKLMFWKKDKKKAADSLKVAPQVNPADSLAQDDFNFDDPPDSAASKQSPIEPPKKKKGIMGLFKKKSKAAPVDPSKSPAKKEEDGQGF
jgi:hypothetical protein